MSRFTKSFELNFFKALFIYFVLTYVYVSSLLFCVVFSKNVEEVIILLRFLGYPWRLMIFVVSSISSILSLFLSF